jgi:rhamnosyltransferase
MTNNTPDVSIIIVARNEEAHLKYSLPIISGQNTYLSFEIIGIDTESEDGTPKIFNQYSTKTISIKKADFHHVKTRNYSVAEAKGRYIVFLTGDAVPQGGHWLENLVRPLNEDARVAASYSRQLPNPKAYPWEARDIYAGGGLIRKVKEVNLLDPQQAEDYKKNIWKYIAFSNVSACYRKELLLKYPFNENLSELEDQEWSKRLIELGFKIIFEPASAVIHSHNDTLKRLYKRQFIYGKCFKVFVNKSLNGALILLSQICYDIILDYYFILSMEERFLKKIILFAKTPIFRFVKRYAFYQGFNHAR